MENSSRNLSSRDVRRDFIDYFVQRQHVNVPSSPTLPHDDPTLLFTNAGMNQFKNIFLGLINPESTFGKLKRACNSQKCIRAGGKHNDLDDVGKDVYHHTFFEMLGNWSFNDYFKKDAIHFAWDLLTRVWNLPKDRFYVTYFQGTADVPADEESHKEWLACGLQKDRILPFGMKDNFWEMGDTGPCGPCSEIHFDRIGNRDASSLVNRDDPNVIEIWNLVFIQYNREQDGSLVKLPTCHVDTGMGFERIVSVLQNKTSNYDTDVFEPYFVAIQKLTGMPSYQNLVGPNDPEGINMAYRVIADHIRTLTISISDGCRPSSVGRGYVVRRILRRAIRFAQEKLNMPKGLLSSLVDVARDQLGDVFPEVKDNCELVKSIIDQEERQFLTTLSKGRTQLNKAFSSSTNSVISGKVGWLLYETYGFPIDLTQLMAQERGFTVDIEEYEQEKQKAQVLSQKSSTFKGVVATVGVQDIEKLKEMQIKVTDTSAKYEIEYCPGVNYNPETDSYIFGDIESVIKAIKVGEELVENVIDGPCCIFLEKTNFYAEEGGQQADRGLILAKEGRLLVQDVQVYAGYVGHLGEANGSISVGDKVKCKIEHDRRILLMMNHTSTHLLNFALRKTIGQTDQRGSLVSPEKLRFDFQFDRPLKDEEIVAIDSQINEMIISRLEIDTGVMDLSEAKKIGGIRAVFGETYPDVVRVVTVGIAASEILKVENPGITYSIELCGGLHVVNTSHIRKFVTVSEEGIGKGLRRVVCLTGEEATRAHLLEANWRLIVEQIERNDAVTTEFDRRKTLDVVSVISNYVEKLSKEVLSLPAKNEIKKRLNDLKLKLSRSCDKQDEILIKSISEDLMKLAIETKTKFVVIKTLPQIHSTRSLEAVCKGKNFPFFMMCQDDKQKICFVCSVPKNNKEISAKNWSQYVCEQVGAKSHGNDLVCRGSISEDVDMERLKKFAKEYIVNQNNEQFVIYN
ncbi:Alanine--tRNA ligase, cytoplasmic [Thelohanellus kitauei]|uniref:Alanine--tRNA ligase n=1 Tax=Thelohanellus kitauei TaxID=669202 RepID=A0A0C2J2P9_THEKT|nr:Alanine--tRNA ligase, cytoplasmic [Thelohanellus kitauei]